MSSQDAETIQVFSDYVCPFCYLGRESLRQYQEQREQELEIDWRPFDLRAQKRGENGEIQHDVDDGKDDAYYEQAKQNVRRLQEKYDVEMTVDLATDIDSFDAQVLSYYISQNYPYETWLEFDRAVFDELWIEGKDIGDRDLLLDLAEDVGVDREEANQALDDADLRTEVTQKFQEAHEMGISGVPTFVYDQYAARGAVPPEQLERLVEGN